MDLNFDELQGESRYPTLEREGAILLDHNGNHDRSIYPRKSS